MNSNNDILIYDRLLSRSSPAIKSIFYDIKDMARKLDDSFFEQINKSMLTIKKIKRGRERGVIWLEPGVNYIKIYLAKNKYRNFFYEIFPDGFGGYPYIKVSQKNYDKKQIECLAKQALEKIESII